MESLFSFRPLRSRFQSLNAGGRRRHPDLRLQTFSHDADGNMTTGPSGTASYFWNYTWDSRNQLTSINEAFMSYDTEGQRTGINDYGQATTFVTDPHGRSRAYSGAKRRATGGATLSTQAEGCSTTSMSCPAS